MKLGYCMKWVLCGFQCFLFLQTHEINLGCQENLMKDLRKLYQSMQTYQQYFTECNQAENKLKQVEKQVGILYIGYKGIHTYTMKIQTLVLGGRPEPGHLHKPFSNIIHLNSVFPPDLQFTGFHKLVEY